MDMAYILPTVNASLNGLAGMFLICGFHAIKKGNRVQHQKFMMSALICSALFLISYITYHYLKAGVVTHYQGEGLLRIIYFTILLTHTPLATLIIPFCIAAVIYAFKGDFQKHTRITRWLYPAWMYVSVTGVLIYLMLYVFPA